jgi:WD40 repeat protein
MVPIVVAILLGALAVAPAAAEPTTRPAIAITKLDRTTPVDFEAEILPILRDNCLACHNRTRAKADLVLETPADIRKGSENGPVLVPGDAEKSLLLQASAHQTKPPMPPRDNKVSAIDLTSDQLGLIRLWIEQGAKGEVRPPPPIAWQVPSAGLQPVYAVALTPDGRYAAAGRANHVDLYDLSARRLIGSLSDPQLLQSGLYGPAGAAHRDMVESLAFSPDGNLLASGSFAEVKLWRRAAPSPKFTLPVTGANVVAASADGRHIAVACEGSAIRVFDADGGKQSGVIASSTSAPRAAGFSADGSMLAIASADRGVRVSAVTGELLAQTVSPTDVNAIAWIAGGKQFATAGADGVVRVWQVPKTPAVTWSAPKELKGHAGAVTALAALPGTAQILSGGADGSIRLWNLSDGQAVRQLSQGSPVTALAVRPDGKFFASAGKDNAAHLWDAAKGTAVTELKGNVFASRELADRDRDQQLAAGNVAYNKAAVETADAAQKAVADRLKAATDAKAAADKVAADKEAIRAKVVADKDAADKALAAQQAAIQQGTTAADAAEQQAKAAQQAIAAAKTDAGTSPDNLKALEDDLTTKTKAAAEARAAAANLSADPKPKQAAADATKALEEAEAALKPALLSRQNAETEFRLATTASARAAGDLSAARLALASAGEALQRADAALAAVRQAAASAPNLTRALAFSGDNLTLATAGNDSLVTLWSADSGILVDTIRTDCSEALAFCGDRLLISGAGHAALWSLGGTWSLERTLGTGDAESPLTDRVNAVAFSPDGQLLATGAGEPSRSGQVKLWEANTGRPIREFADAHSDAVLSLEFSPDGGFLASGAADRFARLLDVSSGKVVKSFEGHTDHVLGVSWRADGRVLATCGADGQVKFWLVATGDRKASVAGPTKAVAAVHFLGVSDQALAVSGDGQVRILNDAGAVVRTVAGIAPEFFQASAVTPDGHWAAVAGQTGQLTVWHEPPDAGAPITFPPPSDRTVSTR